MCLLPLFSSVWLLFFFKTCRHGWSRRCSVALCNLLVCNLKWQIWWQRWRVFVCYINKSIIGHATVVTHRVDFAHVKWEKFSLFNFHVQQRGKFRYVTFQHIAHAWAVISSFPSTVNIHRVQVTDYWVLCSQQADIHLSAVV